MRKDNEKAKGFTCAKCGKAHEFSMYVFAHWNNELEHKCDCGARHAIQRGKAWSLDENEAANAELTGASGDFAAKRPR